ALSPFFPIPLAVLGHEAPRSRRSRLLSRCRAGRLQKHGAEPRAQSEESVRPAIFSQYPPSKLALADPPLVRDGFGSFCLFTLLLSGRLVPCGASSAQWG